MQDKFCSPLQFLQRTDALASALGCYLKEVPEKIGISERAMFGYRAGKYPVTAKALRKLEAAEALAGIQVEDANIVSRETLKKGSEKDESAVRSGNPNESPPPRDELLTVLTRIAEALEALVETRRESASEPPTSSAGRGEKSA
jgi:hypothetical protein